MNNKPLIPLLVKLGIAGGIVWAFASLFSDNEAENKPETASANGTPERPVSLVPPVSAGNSTENRGIPANSSGKLAAPSPPAAIPANSVPAMPKIPIPTQPATIPVVKSAAQAPLSAIKRKLITQDDVANVFHRGARALTRKDSVAALIGLGFGKSAAYDALSEDGRFVPWLRFAPDGMITWNGQ